jgi:hypothetical protein
MKKILSIFALTGVILLVGIVAFGQQKTKTLEVGKDAGKAKKKLTIIEKDSTESFKKFKRESDLKIVLNQKKIEVLNAKKLKEDEKIQTKYDKKISELEEKNENLKLKIEIASTGKKYIWSSIKREFKHEVDEFASAFKNIGVDNYK